MKAKEAEEKAIAAESKASAAEERASAAERENDRLDAYQRRETLVSSGQIIPVERIEESTSDIIVGLVNKYLTVKISKEDINISHRLGSTNNTRRPVIVKFFSRDLKYAILSYCIALVTEKKLKDFFINEHLTTKRKKIFMSLRHIRKAKPSLFRQLFTKDGEIIVKLQNSAEKIKITSEKHFYDLLKEYPFLEEIHMKLLKSKVAPS